MNSVPAPDNQHGGTAAPQIRGFNGKAMSFGFVLTAVFDIGLAIVAFNVVKKRGGNDQLAYLASGIGPLTMMVITWIRAKKLSGASIVILLFLLLSAAAAIIGGADSRLLIVKDSLVTGGFGAACLVSLLLPKPLMFYFGAKFATDGTPDGLGYWCGLWKYPGFRTSQYLINNVWGIAFLIEAGLRVLIAYMVPDFDLAYTIAAILPFFFLAALISYTIMEGNRARSAAADRIAAADRSAGRASPPEQESLPRRASPPEQESLPRRASPPEQESLPRRASPPEQESLPRRASPPEQESLPDRGQLPGEGPLSGDEPAPGQANG